MRASSGTFRAVAQLFGRGLTSALPESSSRVKPALWKVNAPQLRGFASTSETQPKQEDHPPSSSSSEDDTSPSTSATTRLPLGQIDFSKRQMVMVFTCGQCEVRAAKTFSKMAYTSGVVLVECPGCGSRHLVADHLGWFGSKGNIEDFAAEKGNMVVTRLADNTLELTPEDVAGLAQGVAEKK